MTTVLTYLDNHQWIYAVIIAVTIPVMGFANYCSTILAKLEIPFWKSMIFGAGTFAVACVAGYFIMTNMMPLDPEDSIGNYHYLGGGLTFLASLVLGFVVYVVAMTNRVGTSLTISTLESFLRIFLVLVLAGIGAVVVAGMQMAEKPGGTRMLRNLGIGTGVILVGFFLIFFLSAMIRNRSIR